MPVLNTTTTKLLKSKRDAVNRMIDGVNADRDLLAARKQIYTSARDQLTGILDGTITGDAAISALAAALGVL